MLKAAGLPPCTDVVWTLRMVDNESEPWYCHLFVAHGRRLSDTREQARSGGVRKNERAVECDGDCLELSRPGMKAASRGRKEAPARHSGSLGRGKAAAETGIGQP